MRYTVDIPPPPAEIPEAYRCEPCEGEGAYSRSAACTTFGPDCACNGPLIVTDPCPYCGGDGVAPQFKEKD